LLKNPPILLLDEVTSALDQISEKVRREKERRRVRRREEEGGGRMEERAAKESPNPFR
jgi:ABC-type multidrug transport system ATPase subunit